MVRTQRTRIGFRGFRGLILVGPRRGFYLGLNAPWFIRYRNFCK